MPRVLVASMTCMLLLASPASGSTNATSWSDALHAVEARIAPLRAKVAETRAALEGDGLTSVVDATAIVAGLPSSAPRIEPASSFNEAIQLIASAVTEGEAIVRASEASRLGRTMGIERARALMLRAIVAPGTIRPDAPHPGSSAALRAAGILAAAVDAALPALRAASERMPQRAGAVDGCDVLEQGYLCVGGTGDNVYVADADVTVDLGGNDTYRNSAGAAPNGVGSVVSLVLDVSGNDTYAAPKDSFLAQGAGALGGVGMLADMTGNDTYLAETTKYQTRMGTVGTLTGGSQAQGSAALGGAGFLIDGQGNDTYTVKATTVGVAAGAGGQGSGFFAGSAALVDGGGDDTYSTSAIAQPLIATVTDEEGVKKTVSQYGLSGTNGQGYAGVFQGAGLLADSGGVDSFSMSARITGSAPDAPLVFTPGSTTGLPNVSLAGQGAGIFGGAALLLEGQGKTTYSASAVAEPTPTMAGGVPASVIAQGVGAFAAAAAISDLAGDDTYSATASTASSVAVAPEDDCEPCPVTADSTAGTLALAAQGMGGTGSGLLEDGAGNDTLSVTGSSASALSVDDRRTTMANPISGIASVGTVTSQTQGHGISGTGFLRNVGDNDSYVQTLTTDTSVEASSVLPENGPDLSEAEPTLVVEGQGAGSLGAGAIYDVGGSDTYRATISPTPSAPTTSISIRGQGAAIGTLGGLGVAVDLDGVGADTYVQQPASLACSGTRGVAAWADCGYVGFGVNA